MPILCLCLEQTIFCFKSPFAAMVCNLGLGTSPERPVALDAFFPEWDLGPYHWLWVPDSLAVVKSARGTYLCWDTSWAGTGPASMLPVSYNSLLMTAPLGFLVLL